jgi:hypothetical protein
MSLLLINPPISRYDNAELTPPLSLLTLACSARTKGIDTSILDLNLPPHRDMADYPDRYSSYVLELVAQSRACEVGITSMGVNSHIAISIANLVREHLGLPVTLGGTHLCSIPEVVQFLCPGLSCLATPALRESLDNRDKWWAAEPRDAAGSGENPRRAEELFAAVELDSYFRWNRRRLANFEAGKGCRYRCSFCYSPATYPSWLNYQAAEVVQEFSSLYEIGFRHVFLVQDNLLNDPRWFNSLLKGLSALDNRPSWNGYATLPDLDAAMLPDLVASGCRNLYVGIDSAEKSQQRSWKKIFFNEPSSVVALVKAATEIGLAITCAFIIDPDPDAESATTLALDLALELRSAGAEIRLSALTPYPRTGLFRTRDLLYSEDRPAVLMDLPEVVVRNSYAEDFVEAFPWHSRPLSVDNWQEFLLTVNAAQTLLNDREDVDLGHSGKLFWQHCQDVVIEVSELEGVHKTELKTAFRSSCRNLQKEIARCTSS